MINLKFPYSEEDIRKLKVGDMVNITGTLLTGRDAVHKDFMREQSHRSR